MLVPEFVDEHLILLAYTTDYYTHRHSTVDGNFFDIVTDLKNSQIRLEVTDKEKKTCILHLETLKRGQLELPLHWLEFVRKTENLAIRFYRLRLYVRFYFPKTT